jgi:hypothetical protein
LQYLDENKNTQKHDQFGKLQGRLHSIRSRSDKAYQLLARGRWFSPGSPASSITKTGRHDIAEILLKVALNTKAQTQITFLQGVDIIQKKDETIL